MAHEASRDDLLWRWRPVFGSCPLGFAYSLALRIAVGIGRRVRCGSAPGSANYHVQKVEHAVQSNAPDVGVGGDVPALRHDPAYLLLSVTVASFVLGGCAKKFGGRRFWPGFAAFGQNILAAAKEKWRRC